MRLLHPVRGRLRLLCGLRSDGVSIRVSGAAGGMGQAHAHPEDAPDGAGVEGGQVLSGLLELDGDLFAVDYFAEDGLSVHFD